MAKLMRLHMLQSQHPAKQFRMIAQGSFLPRVFLEKISAILPISNNNEKNSILMFSVKNGFFYRKSCKFLQNFVNMEAPITHTKYKQFQVQMVNSL